MRPTEVGSLAGVTLVNLMLADASSSRQYVSNAAECGNCNASRTSWIRGFTAGSRRYGHAAACRFRGKVLKNGGPALCVRDALGGCKRWSKFEKVPILKFMEKIKKIKFDFAITHIYPCFCIVCNVPEQKLHVTVCKFRKKQRLLHEMSSKHKLVGSASLFGWRRGRALLRVSLDFFLGRRLLVFVRVSVAFSRFHWSFSLYLLYHRVRP